jgi:hypothetical protein
MVIEITIQKKVVDVVEVEVSDTFDVEELTSDELEELALTAADSTHVYHDVEKRVTGEKKWQK